jgi:hypothetical protein
MPGAFCFFNEFVGSFSTARHGFQQLSGDMIKPARRRLCLQAKA